MNYWQGKKTFRMLSFEIVQFLLRSDLAILCVMMVITTTISGMSISPHGGYLSIDEGTDFYLECIGNDPQWILAKRVTSESTR